MPYFADAESLEICEAKSEKGAEEGKEKSGAEKDFFKISDWMHAFVLNELFHNKPSRSYHKVYFFNVSFNYIINSYVNIFICKNFVE